MRGAFFASNAVTHLKAILRYLREGQLARDVSVARVKILRLSNR
jgi:hypothetical protein